MAVFCNASSFLATRATAAKSRAMRTAVARPMPGLAPVTIATELVFFVSSVEVKFLPVSFS
jgi:hypothetical protein